MTDDLPVDVTVAAKSKAFRMYTEMELVDLARRAWNGNLRTYQKGDSNEFHALSDDYAIVIKPENGRLVVITQMHQHADYHDERIYRYVDSIKEVTSAHAEN